MKRGPRTAGLVEGMMPHGEFQGTGCTRFCFGCLIVLTLVGCQSSRESRTSSNAIRALGLTRFGGYVELLATLREEDSNPAGGVNGREARETVLEEALALALAGYVYHANLFSFELDTRAGLVQRSFDEDLGSSTSSASENEFIGEFDFKGEVLKKKTYPATIFASRKRRLEARSFRSSVETTTTSYGALWSLRHAEAPTTIQFSYQDLKLEPLDDAPDGRQKYLTFRLDTGYRFSSDNELKLSYEHRELDERPIVLSLDSDDLNLNHVFRFGEDRRSRLHTHANLLDQRGNIDLRRTRLREILELQLTDTLRSRAILTYQDQERESAPDISSISEETWSALGVLEYRHYDSVVTRLEADYRKQAFDLQGDIEELGGRLVIDYRKTTSIGQLQVGYTLSVEQDDRGSGQDLRIDVLDEVHTFQDPLPIVLDRLNVVESTIVVTAIDNFTVYTRGVDYEVFTVGDRTEIQRLVTGAIGPGDTVLVDYTFVSIGSHTLTAVTHNLVARHEFDFGLSAHYRLRTQDQSIDPTNVEGVTIEDLTIHVVGLQYRSDAFDALAEYESQDSNIDSFTTLRLTGGYVFRPGERTLLTLRSGYTRRRRQDADLRKTSMFTTNATYRARFHRNLSLSAMAQYRNGSDSVTGRDEGLDVTLTVDWTQGRIETRLIGRYSFLDSSFADQDTWHLFLQTRIRF